MSERSHIQRELFEFLTELRNNNNRDWFQSNKRRYEKQLREPLLQFINDFRFRLHSISPHFVADARKSGGSLFRIYRDVRFSKDKSPFKTAAGIQFRHEKAKDAHAPGFYLHLEPGNVFAAMGVWHPDSRTLFQIRNAISRQSNRWTDIISEDQFAANFQIGGESLKRAPKGFDPDHPLIEHLKMKDYVAFRNIEEPETFRENFIDRYAEICRHGSSYIRFLTESLGLDW